MDDYYDLGTYSRKVTTVSGEAQRWFDRGLIWCFGFHHEEAEVCFRRAAELDPGCAMAHWGVAYAVGPNYNKQWDAFDEADLLRTLEAAHAAAQAALACMDGASDPERALIQALARRHPSDERSADFDAWNDDYANAMRAVYQAHPDDLDVCTLFADALMNRTPWRLWDLHRGEPAEGADTLEVGVVLETAIAQMEAAGDERHAGVLHMYIHLMEMSPHPEKALRAADELRNLVPDAGHLQHMPSHIHFLCGHYHDVVVSNSEAIVADRKYLAREGPLNYYSASRIHNYHFKLYGAMFLGQYKAAMDAADELIETLPEELLRIESPPMADLVEAYVPMKMHALIRFGKWREILDEPLPDDQDLYCVTTAVKHYAKTAAHAVCGNVAEAQAQRQLFRGAVSNVPETRTMFNNTCLDILAVAAEMLDGEIEYRRGNHDVAFRHLRDAVELEDNLPYDEPWAWMQPARHALGALLLEQDAVEVAEAVYRADLGLDDSVIRARRHPDNVWSLHGLHECLRRQDKRAEAAMIEPRLTLAIARADVPITSSCYCRAQTAR